MSRAQKQAAAIAGAPFIYKGITNRRVSLAVENLQLIIGNDFPRAVDLKALSEIIYLLSHSVSDVAAQIADGTFDVKVLEFSDTLSGADTNAIIVGICKMVTEDNSTLVEVIQSEAAAESKKKSIP